MERKIKNAINMGRGMRINLYIILLLVLNTYLLSAQVNVRQDSTLSQQTVINVNTPTILTNDININTPPDTIPQASLLNSEGTYILKANMTGIDVNYLTDAQTMVDSINIIADLVKPNFPAINVYDYGTYLFQQLYTYEGGLEAFILGEFTKDHGNSDQYIILYRILDPNSGYQQTKVIMKLPQTISPCLQIAQLNSDLNAYSSGLYERYKDQIGSIQVELLRYIMFKVGKLGCCVGYTEENRGKIGQRSNLIQCDADDIGEFWESINAELYILGALACTGNELINTEKLTYIGQSSSVPYMNLSPFLFRIYKNYSSCNQVNANNISIDSLIQIGTGPRELSYKKDTLVEEFLINSTIKVKKTLTKKGLFYSYNIGSCYYIDSEKPLNASTLIEIRENSSKSIDKLIEKINNNQNLDNLELESLATNIGCYLGKICTYTEQVIATADKYFFNKHFTNYSTNGPGFGFYLLRICDKDPNKNKKVMANNINKGPGYFLGLFRSLSDLDKSHFLNWFNLQVYPTHLPDKSHTFINSEITKVLNLSGIGCEGNMVTVDERNLSTISTGLYSIPAVIYSSLPTVTLDPWAPIAFDAKIDKGSLKLSGLVPAVYLCEIKDILFGQRIELAFDITLTAVAGAGVIGGLKNLKHLGRVHKALHYLDGVSTALGTVNSLWTAIGDECETEACQRTKLILQLFELLGAGIAGADAIKGFKSYIDGERKIIRGLSNDPNSSRLTKALDDVFSPVSFHKLIDLLT